MGLTQLLLPTSGAAAADGPAPLLAHPRGRISGSRAGVIANWDAVFEAAALRGVAIEIGGESPSELIVCVCYSLGATPSVASRFARARPN